MISQRVFLITLLSSGFFCNADKIVRIVYEYIFNIICAHTRAVIESRFFL